MAVRMVRSPIQKRRKEQRDREKAPGDSMKLQHWEMSEIVGPGVVMQPC